MKVSAILTILLAIAGFACGCKDRAAEGKAERAAKTVTITLAPARAGPVQRHVDVIRTLFSNEETTVSAKVPNRIMQIAKDVGDRVAPGETLAQIDKTNYDLAVAQKQMAAAAALAKLGLANMPPSDFDLALVPTIVRARLQSANTQAKFERGKRLHDPQPPLM